jgi:4-hydroxy-3-methylbut-2-en-1-yl diphosphate reductase
MQITVAKNAGFCFGVKHAIDMALDSVRTHNNVCMLGDIVHNEDVISHIENSGVEKIKDLEDGTDSALLIRAHGSAISTIEKAKKLGYTIIDATCPMVKEIHAIARQAEKDGFKVIIIGDKKHDEVAGIVGQLNTRPYVIDTIDNVPDPKEMPGKVAVVVQSTQNIEKVEKIVEALKNIIDQVEFHNTICDPTTVKQTETKELAKNNKAMLVIGSKTSANTKRLYELSSAINPNTYWVRSKDEIDLAWFEGVDTLGVTAGASTPDTTIEQIIEYIEQ